MNLGERLNKVREGLSLREFAERLSSTECSFEKGNISKYERGIVKPSTEFYSAVCKVFNVNLNWLINGVGDVYINDCSEGSVNREIERLKKENEAVKKMVGIEAIKYINNSLIKASSKPLKRHKK